ncbi:MAG: hypothetical protein NTY81_00335 [Candidatus Staskawiczbacteria bacterium]|nr:hypothetical protein [Candidatus Staskawiczbacteria bacterium]
MTPAEQYEFLRFIGSTQDASGILFDWFGFFVVTEGKESFEFEPLNEYSQNFLATMREHFSAELAAFSDTPEPVAQS